jgi:phage gpG-like protein
MSYKDKWGLNPEQIKEVFGGVQSVAKRFIMDNFKSQGFNDSGVTSWRPKKKNDGRAILTGKSNPHMRQSFHFSSGKDFVKITNSKKYSGIHNDGEGKMPMRRMIGDSKTLNKMVSKSIELRVKKMFKK